MKKRVLLICLLSALLPLVLLLTGLSLPKYYGESYYAELSDMYCHLQQADKKKIVIIGGSNVAFGVNSALLETLLFQQGYDYSVCNFGLYGAVGVDVMLTLAESALQEGDIAVLAIEPTSESFSSYFGATAFWKCAEADYSLLLPLDGSQQASLAGNYLSYLQDRLEISRSGIMPGIDGVYAKSSFDAHCDMIFDRPENVMTLGYDTASLIDLTNISIDSAFSERVKQFAHTAQARNARVVISFCPMNRSAMKDDSDETVYAFFSRVLEAFSCPVISDPNDYIMESCWFYDSNFHLNSSGAEVRTYFLAQDLLNDMGCFSALEYSLPEKPEQSFLTQDIIEETDDFLFQPIDGGYVISGLNESGKRKTSLTVPTSYAGQPVVGFTAQTFAGNLSLEELILPETVESIPDGAFSGCRNLRILWLLHRNFPPSIGENPFAGTEQLTIRVPVSAYSLYRDGAGCASSLWEAYLPLIETF